jgi:hypothetical protein
MAASPSLLVRPHANVAGYAQQFARLLAQLSLAGWHPFRDKHVSLVEAIFRRVRIEAGVSTDGKAVAHAIVVFKRDWPR